MQFADQLNCYHAIVVDMVWLQHGVNVTAGSDFGHRILSDPAWQQCYTGELRTSIDRSSHAGLISRLTSVKIQAGLLASGDLR